MLGEQLDQEVVRRQVAGVLELAAGQPGLADLEQSLACSLGQPGSQGVVVSVQGTLGAGHPPTLTSPGPTHLTNRPYAQLEFGSDGSASFGMHLHGSNFGKVTGAGSAGTPPTA